MSAQREEMDDLAWLSDSEVSRSDSFSVEEMDLAELTDAMTTSMHTLSTATR